MDSDCLFAAQRHQRARQRGGETPPPTLSIVEEQLYSMTSKIAERSWPFMEPGSDWWHEGWFMIPSHVSMRLKWGCLFLFWFSGYHQREINKVRGTPRRSQWAECTSVFWFVLAYADASEQLLQPHQAHQLVSVGTLVFSFQMQQISLKKDIKNSVWVAWFHFWMNPNGFWYE